MKTSIAGSIQAYASARPPAVTFILGVIGITLALLIVAFNIKNIEVAYDLRLKEDWNNFMDLLSKQKLCSNLSEGNQSSLITPLEAARLSNSTFLPVKIKHLSADQFQLLKMKKSPIVFAGNISFEGWKRTCDSDAGRNDNVTLILVVPSGSLDSPDKITSCVHFNGPPHLFFPTSLISGVPSFVTSAKCSNLNISHHQVINLFAFRDQNQTRQTIARTNSNYCDIKDTMTLSYDPKIYRPQVQLTNAEKYQIFSHLLLGVYFLLGFICVLLLIAILQGRKLLLTTRHSLLPTKETL